MTKEQLFKRFETAYKMGLLTPEVLKLMDRWTEGYHRLLGGQLEYFLDTLNAEADRTGRFHPSMQLANDKNGYKVIQLMAILTHHCQTCAEDTEAWHTRSGFCPHKK